MLCMSPCMGDWFYRVEVRSPGAKVVKGYFDLESEAEAYMSEIDKDYDSPTSCLWLVEVAPDGTEKDLYGYT